MNQDKGCQRCYGVDSCYCDGLLCTVRLARYHGFETLRGNKEQGVYPNSRLASSRSGMSEFLGQGAISGRHPRMYKNQLSSAHHFQRQLSKTDSDKSLYDLDKSYDQGLQNKAL